MPETLGLPQWIVLAVVLQRLAELAIAQRNTARLMAQGGTEIGRAHYFPIVAIHAAWLVAIFVRVPPDAALNTALLVAFLMLQLGRVWVIASLGRYWTTRIITLPGAPLVTSGPYRWFRHPNYIIVALELAILPLAFADWIVAAAFTGANAALMSIRIPMENKALATRRACEARRGL